MSLTAPAAREIAAAVDEFGVPVPPSLARAVRILDSLEASRALPTIDFLTASDTEIAAHVDALVLRRASSGTNGEIYADMTVQVGNQVLEATADALRDREFDLILDGLRPRFDKPAKRLEAAAQAGITSRTTSDDILARADTPEILDTWRDVAPAITEIHEVASLVIRITETLGLPPQRQSPISKIPTLSVLFSRTGWGGPEYRDSPYASIDWLMVAAGGLRLNSLEQVREIIADQPRTPIAPLFAPPPPEPKKRSGHVQMRQRFPSGV